MPCFPQVGAILTDDVDFTQTRVSRNRYAVDMSFPMPHRPGQKAENTATVFASLICQIGPWVVGAITRSDRSGYFANDYYTEPPSAATLMQQVGNLK